jgi:chromosome segregation ATPase
MNTYNQKPSLVVSTSPPFIPQERPEEFKTIPSLIDSTLTDREGQTMETPMPDKIEDTTENILSVEKKHMMNEESMDTNEVIEENQPCTMEYIQEQEECIAANNNSLQIQYEQMMSNQAYLQQQEQMNHYNLGIAARLGDEIMEYQTKINQLQQQVYYHRSELDKLAEQVVAYEAQIQRQLKIIREQDTQIENNNRVLEYDKNLLGSFGQTIQALQTPPYTDQLMKVALMNYSA